MGLDILSICWKKSKTVSEIIKLIFFIFVFLSAVCPASGEEWAIDLDESGNLLGVKKAGYSEYAIPNSAILIADGFAAPIVLNENLSRQAKLIETAYGRISYTYSQNERHLFVDISYDEPTALKLLVTNNEKPEQLSTSIFTSWIEKYRITQINDADSQAAQVFVETRFWVTSIEGPNLIASANGRSVIISSGDKSAHYRLRLKFIQLSTDKGLEIDKIFLFQNLKFVPPVREMLVQASHFVDGLPKSNFNSLVVILLLSFSCRILLSPIDKLRSHFNCELQRRKDIIGPKIQLIKKKCRGEKAHNETLAVYKAHGFSPYYSVLPNAVSLLQLPVVFMFFNFLLFAPCFNGLSFFWISNLAFAEQINFGNFSIHILPIALYLLYILGVWMQANDKIFLKCVFSKQSLLAATVTVLVYDFPAVALLFLIATYSLTILQRVVKKSRLTPIEWR